MFDLSVLAQTLIAREHPTARAAEEEASGRADGELSRGEHAEDAAVASGGVVTGVHADVCDEGGHGDGIGSLEDGVGEGDGVGVVSSSREAELGFERHLHASTGRVVLDAGLPRGEGGVGRLRVEGR